MTQPPTPSPKDDRDLINFLQQHRPQPPAAPPDLEERILHAIEHSGHRQVQRRRWYRSPWLPTAIAASLIAGLLGGYRTIVPSRPSPAQLEALEAFIETTWEASVNDDTEDEWPILRSQQSQTHLVANSSDSPSPIFDFPLPDRR
ncbi:hypothetical protein [Leptothermofonsia sp. ETS-13]|uniref:hypothetical protein n=1 Tax=Leptothermofonsia sp. ETS-13 TaxID=3035696 RepID=UPI003BA2ED57